MKLPLWLQTLTNEDDLPVSNGDSNSTSPALQARLDELRKLTAKDIMVPRALVAALDADVQLRRVKRLKSSKQHFFPVYKGDLDHILGWIPKTKVLELLNDPNEAYKLSDHVRAVGSIVETLSVPEIADHFIKSSSPFLIVKTTDQTTAGIIPLAQFVELIFGVELEPGPTSVTVDLGPAPLRNYEL